MSVLIRGMKMPKRCKTCQFSGFGGIRGELHVCMFTGENQPTLSQERMSGCPLIELPPHGRLIDTDELAKEILTLQKYRFSIEDPEIFVSRKAVMQAIKDEHAIVEADDTIKTPLFDIVEEHDHCHVQVLKNSITGEISVGWWKEEE